MLENHWLLDRSVTFLNHGSYGAVPRDVLDYQRELQERMEKQPLAFLGRDLEGLLDTARSNVAGFVGVDADDLVFVPNATHAVNTILRSLVWEKGDEILITDQTYNACKNAVEYIAAREGITITVTSVPFPLRSPEEITEAIFKKVRPRTKLALLDHVTSVTALIWPIEEIVREFNELGIDTLVDGAHALGCIPLNVKKIAPTYYTANAHKWLCSPKGAAFLYVRRDKQKNIRPLSISHGANSPRLDRSRFQLAFGWTGTDDPTAYLCVPRAIQFLQSLYPGGFPELWRRNHELTLQARNLLCHALNVEPPCPNEMLGSMASILLPQIELTGEELYKKLIDKYSIEVPIMPWRDGAKILRISVQAYNSLPQYEYLARCLREIFYTEI
jgi:isopenicillin-N epimerase